MWTIAHCRLHVYTWFNFYHAGECKLLRRLNLIFSSSRHAIIEYFSISVKYIKNNVFERRRNMVKCRLFSATPVATSGRGPQVENHWPILYTEHSVAPLLFMKVTDRGGGEREINRPEVEAI